MLTHTHTRTYTRARPFFFCAYMIGVGCFFVTDQMHNQIGIELMPSLEGTEDAMAEKTKEKGGSNESPNLQNSNKQHLDQDQSQDRNANGKTQNHSKDIGNDIESANTPVNTNGGSGSTKYKTSDDAMDSVKASLSAPEEDGNDADFGAEDELTLAGCILGGEGEEDYVERCGSDGDSGADNVRTKQKKRQVFKICNRVLTVSLKVPIQTKRTRATGNENRDLFPNIIQ